MDEKTGKKKKDLYITDETFVFKLDRGYCFCCCCSSTDEDFRRRNSALAAAAARTQGSADISAGGGVGVRGTGEALLDRGWLLHCCDSVEEDRSSDCC